MNEEKKIKKSFGRKELDRLQDIKQAIRSIHGHPKFSKGEKAWLEDEYFRGYCERQLSIIGEAASKLASEHQYDELYPEIEWALIKGMRTILVHVYWKTDPNIVWDIVDKHVPELEMHVDKWLKHKKKELKTDSPETDTPIKESKLHSKLKERYPKGSRKYSQSGKLH